jgi:hypothetical protein
VEELLLSVIEFCNVSDVRQIEIHTAEALVPAPNHLEVEISIAKLKKYKSPGSDQIPSELYQAGGEILVFVIHIFLISISKRKNCLISGRSLLFYQFTRWVIKLTVIIIVGYHCYQPHTKFYQMSFIHG